MPAIAGLTEVLADAGWGHHGWGWGGLMMVGWWLLVGLAIFFAVRRVAPSSPAPSAGRQTAREILDERFARGEIDDAEYRERLEVLEERS